MAKMKLSLLRAIRSLASWLGYVGLVFEYVLLALFYVKAVLDVPVVQTIIGTNRAIELPTPTEDSVPGMVFNPLPGWMAALIAVLLGAALLYGIYRMISRDVPETKEKAERAVQTLARKTVQKIEHGKKVSKKRTVLLTDRTAYWIKIIIATIPLVVLFVFQNVQMIVSWPAAFVCLGVVALFTMCWFTLERFLAERLASSK